MKMVTGGSLAGRASELVKDPKAAVRVLSKVCRAVDFAHRRGVLHRDLKPANVVLDADGTPYVTDFGLAKKVEGDSGLTQSGAIVGTPSYMAPDQARAERQLTTAADVYALGAVLYELLTGRPPFRAESVVDTILQVLDRDPAAPTSINAKADRDLSVVALKCLQKDPGRRYESAAALADDLDRWARGEPIAARPVGRLERGWKWVRRNPVVAGSLAVVGLVAVAAFAAVTTALVEVRRQRATAVTRGDELSAANANLLHTQGLLSGSEAAVRERADESARDGYFSAVGLAQRLWQAGDIGAARRAPARRPDRFRGWEWKYLDRQCRPPEPTAAIPGLPLQLDYTHDRRFLNCGLVGHGPEIAVLELADGRDLLHLAVKDGLPLAAVAPDGERPAWAARPATDEDAWVVKVVSIPDGKPVHEYPLPKPAGVMDGTAALRFGPKGELVLARFLIREGEDVVLEVRDLTTGSARLVGSAARTGPDGPRRARPGPAALPHPIVPPGLRRTPVPRVSIIAPSTAWSRPSRWPTSCTSTVNRSIRPRTAGLPARNSESLPGV